MEQGTEHARSLGSHPRLATWSRQASLDSGHRAVLPSDLNVACAGSGQVQPLRLVPKNDSSVLGAQGRAGAGAPRTKATSCSAGRADGGLPSAPPTHQVLTEDADIRPPPGWSKG